MRCLQAHNVTKLVEYISDFLGNPIMYKLKDEDDSSLYGIQIISENMNEKKFIICKCKKRLENRLYMKDIPWFVFQTRTILEKKCEYDSVPKQYLTIQYDTPLKEVNLSMLETTSQVQRYGIDKCPCVDISLFHPSEHYFDKNPSLQTIIDSFDCILYINKEILKN